MLKFIFWLFLALQITSCASTENKTIGLEDYDSPDSTAHGAAYRADAINIRRPMQSRNTDWKPYDFFYKHCTEIGEATFYSKTSYFCNGL
ncbi:MAG: hypothetical protein KDD58_03315 [Bdellovibrionales bacterium]|nr:hypothetical protein [Bdellovibrionales bacterium]